MGGRGPARVPGTLRWSPTDPLSRLEPFPKLVRALRKARVRFVLIGIAGANYFAESAGLIFTTQDRDLFLPPDHRNELAAWKVCRAEGLELWCGDEPLGEPLDAFLAKNVISRRALIRARGNGLLVDLTLVMAGFEFEDVWAKRRYLIPALPLATTHPVKRPRRRAA